MKILQVVNAFKPSWEYGGPARNSYEISKKLLKRGHEITVYTTDRFKCRLSAEKNQPMNVDGIKTYYFRNLSIYPARKMNIPIPYYLPIVAKREISDFDIIHIHEYRILLAVVVHHYAKKYGVPYVLQARGSVLPAFQKQGLKKIFDLFWGSRILKDAAKVIALNKAEAVQYKMMGVDEDKIEIIPNGINSSEYEDLPKRGEFRKKYGIKNNEKMILYLGRVHKTKGIDLLVRAFADSSKKLDNVKLVIVGPDDGFLATLKKQVEGLKIGDKILFTGPIYGKDRLETYVAADVFVTPSYSGFPVTFLEACACGIPIITTNNGDELEWIHGKVGYVVEYDKDQLREAIFNILSDNELRRRFGEEGRRLVKEYFSWDKIVKRVEKTYRDITN